MTALGTPYVFTPNSASGIAAITLPPVKDADDRTSHINRMQNAFQEIEETQGVYLSAGASTLFPSFGELSGTLEISQGYLISYPTSGNPYTASFGGMETALYMLAKAFGAGQGVLTETLPTGTKTAPGGTTLTSRSASCWLHGDLKVQRQAGAPIALVTFTLLVPDCIWTWSDGSITLFV